MVSGNCRNTLLGGLNSCARSEAVIKLLLVARPQFSIFGLALFVFGVTWAVKLRAPFVFSRVLLGYLVLLPAQLSVSYSNDYFDVKVDQYGQPTFFSGGSGILVTHPDLRKSALWMAIALMGCSLTLGLVFQVLYSFSLWFSGFVVLFNLLGWFYTAPPVRLVYRGLGEVALIFLIGLLIPGFGYLVTTGELNQAAWPFVVPLMLYGLAFSLAVEIPDMEADRLGHKRTWVARRGRGFGFGLIAAALLCASLFFLGFPWFNSRGYPLDFRLLGLLSLLPLGAAGLGLLKQALARQAATRMANGIMVTLAIFCLLADGYLIYLTFNSMPFGSP